MFFIFLLLDVIMGVQDTEIEKYRNAVVFLRGVRVEMHSHNKHAYFVGMLVQDSINEADGSV